MNASKKIFVIGFLILLVSGCAVGPNYNIADSLQTRLANPTQLRSAIRNGSRLSRTKLCAISSRQR